MTAASDRPQASARPSGERPTGGCYIWTPPTGIDTSKCGSREPTGMSHEHHAEEPTVSPDLPSGDRSTAPQSDYSTRQVAVGAVVLAVGLVATFGLALALA